MTAHTGRGTLMSPNEIQRCESPERTSPPDRRGVTNYGQGPECRRCRQLEAVCARRGGCCDRCTHWDKFTDDGELKQPMGRPRRSA